MVSLHVRFTESGSNLEPNVYSEKDHYRLAFLSKLVFIDTKIYLRKIGRVLFCSIFSCTLKLFLTLVGILFICPNSIRADGRLGDSFVFFFSYPGEPTMSVAI